MRPIRQTTPPTPAAAEGRRLSIRPRASIADRAGHAGHDKTLSPAVACVVGGRSGRRHVGARREDADRQPEAVATCLVSVDARTDTLPVTDVLLPMLLVVVASVSASASVPLMPIRPPARPHAVGPGRDTTSGSACRAVTLRLSAVTWLLPLTLPRSR